MNVGIKNMITDKQRSVWERCLVGLFILVCLALPWWFDGALSVAVPASVGFAPVLVNILRREHVFTRGPIIATWVFALLLFAVAAGIRYVDVTYRMKCQHPAAPYSEPATRSPQG